MKRLDPWDVQMWIFAIAMLVLVLGIGFCSEPAEASEYELTPEQTVMAWVIRCEVERDRLGPEGIFWYGGGEEGLYCVGETKNNETLWFSQYTGPLATEAVLYEDGSYAMGGYVGCLPGFGCGGAIAKEHKF